MKTGKLLRTVLLVSFLLSVSTGCRHPPKVKVLDPFRDPVPVAKGTNFVPVCNGYFIPESTMLEFLDRMSEKDLHDSLVKPK